MVQLWTFKHWPWTVEEQISNSRMLPYGSSKYVNYCRMSNEQYRDGLAHDLLFVSNVCKEICQGSNALYQLSSLVYLFLLDLVDSWRRYLSTHATSLGMFYLATINWFICQNLIIFAKSKTLMYLIMEIGSSYSIISTYCRVDSAWAYPCKGFIGISQRNMLHEGAMNWANGKHPTDTVDVIMMFISGIALHTTFPDFKNLKSCWCYFQLPHWYLPPWFY